MPEAYEVNVAPPAIRQLSLLPEKFADAVIRFIDGPLRENPLRVTKSLNGDFEGCRGGYVGTSYRVLVEVDHAERVVHVLAVAHRADVYRPR
ncbi:MAG: type II toxin-antitoxin system RelE/ParE family toxin [Protaetiibacter sp.]